MALPVPYRLGTEVSLPDSTRRSGAGGVQLHPNISRPVELCVDRVECAERSQPSYHYGTSESINIEFDGCAERAFSDKGVQKVSVPEEKT